MEMISNIGSEVICDFCNGDGRFTMGGVLVGSYAVCGECSLNHDWMEIAQFNKNLGGFHKIVKDVYMPVFLEIINELDSLEISKANKGYDIVIKTENNKYLLRYTDKGLEEFSKDEISKLWDLDKTFQDNVLAHRKEQTGTSDGISYFMSFDEFFKSNKESK
jgi:hypothetical protein